MNQAQIKTTYLDKKNNMTYHVMASRSLTLEEMVISIRLYNSQSKQLRRKKPERHRTIIFYSEI